jgi:hypothetical protein
MARPDIHRQIVEDRPVVLEKAEIFDLEKIHRDPPRTRPTKTGKIILKI